MNQQVLYFPKEGVAKAVEQFETPFFLYEEARIRENCRNFKAAFEKYFPRRQADTSAWQDASGAKREDLTGDSWAGFRPLYAVKANSNPEILKIIREEGFGFDCSSESECWITAKISGDTLDGKSDVGNGDFLGMFTGNYNPASELEMAKDAGFILNLDDVSMLDFFAVGGGEKQVSPMATRGEAGLEKEDVQLGVMKARDDEVALNGAMSMSVPETLSFRINPGVGKATIASNVFAGPNAKYGVPFEKAAEAYGLAKKAGVKHFGIHMMTGSNVPMEDQDYFANIVRKLFDIVADIKNKTWIEIEFMNIGGGFGVPYRPEEKSLDMEAVAKSVRRAFDEKCREHGLREPLLMAEPGRWIVADAGWLVAKVIVIKDSYKKFVGIDASSNDMPRPAIYGAYHYVSVVKKRNCARQSSAALSGNAEKSVPGYSGQGGLQNLTDQEFVPGNGKSVTGDTFSENLSGVSGSGGEEKELVSIVGRICENNDQLAQDRLLPKCKIGDVIVIHNSGGHAYAMGHNYNGRPRHAEYLLEGDGLPESQQQARGQGSSETPSEAGRAGYGEKIRLRMIRRAETFEDLYRTTEVEM